MATQDFTDIPADDVPAHVIWYDAHGSEIAHDKTTTSWTAEDADGAPSSVVSVVPIVDAIDEVATVTFLASSGSFRVVATTEGAGGSPVRAESLLYNVVPGAPASGTIALGGPA